MHLKPLFISCVYLTVSIVETLTLQSFNNNCCSQLLSASDDTIHSVYYYALIHTNFKYDKRIWMDVKVINTFTPGWMDVKVFCKETLSVFMNISTLILL